MRTNQSVYRTDSAAALVSLVASVALAAQDVAIDLWAPAEHRLAQVLL